MKRILIVLLLLISILSFAQEEIWGYHSLAGSGGGGMVFTVDSENKEVETIHRFGHGYLENDSPTNPVFFENGNGLLYGSIEKQLYSYDPSNQEIIVLLDSLEFGELVAIDENHIYATRLVDTVLDVFAYDIQNNTQEWLLAIPESQGYNHKGYWTKLENGKFYTLTRYGGSEGRGALIEIDVENAISRKAVDFVDAKNPEGSLKIHENGHVYGTTVNGGENGDGVIFMLDPRGEDYVIKASFNDETGRKPKGEMLEASDGNFYGITNYGGEYLSGTIYRFNPVTASIYAIYDIDATSEEFLYHEFNGYLSQLNEHKLIGVIERKGTIGVGKIFTFDILNHELEIVYDFTDDNLFVPIGKLNPINGNFLGVYNLINHYNYSGGIFSFDPLQNEIIIEKEFGRNESAAHGQNPNWMCQGDDGNIYGGTYYGGESNKGIIFEIDYSTGEFTKKMDLAHAPLGIIPTVNSFPLSPGVFVGITRITIDEGLKSEKGSEYIFYEYNYFSNDLKKLITIPDSLVSLTGYKRNSDGHIFFVRADRFVEYIYEDNRFQVTKMDRDMPEMIEYRPGIYIGLADSALYYWDKEANESLPFLGIERFYHENLPANNFTGRLYLYNDLLMGKVHYLESNKYSWDSRYTYNINQDSILEDCIFYFDNDHYFSSFISSIDSEYIINNHNFFASQGRIGKIDFYNINAHQHQDIDLEPSPFNYDYDGDEIHSNAPFPFLSRVNLIRVEKKEERYYWTGGQDSLWYNQNNWYGSKQPLLNSNVLISRSAIRFPEIDTLVEIAKLEVNNGAEITINSNGSLTCDRLINHGKFIMQANEKSKSTFISQEQEQELGGFSYQYQSNKAQQAYIGIPIKETSWFQLDSITAFGYEEGDEEYFLPIEDSAYLFQAMNPYVFDLDSGQVVHFKGESNWGDMEYTFEENRFYSLANPYPSFFNWAELDFTHLSHPALYRFNMEEDQFETYIDGLGDAHPLIQPLDVFWVYGVQNEQMDFLNADRIHASEFQESLNIRDHILKLKVDSKNGSDHTYISFNPSSSPDFEYDKDALKMMPHQNNRPQIFTYGGEQELGINQLPDTTIMDLAVKCESNGSFTITVDSNMGYDYLMLEDLIWNKRINLLEESYTFDYFTSDGNYPFKLYFTDWVLKPVKEGDIDIYYYPESIVVRSRKLIKQADIIFYDLAGKAVLTFTENDFFKFEKAISLPTGHYIVQVRTADVVKNTKVLIRR